MKKSKIAIIALVVVFSIFTLVGCYADSNYLKKVDKYSFWENSADTAIAQTAVYDIVNEHMNNTSDGKVKKAIVLGFDGGRADGLLNILTTDSVNGNNKADSGLNNVSYYSGMGDLLKNEGKAYITFAGGEKGKESQQYTSTAPGWTSILTGQWGYKNGVLNNDDISNMEYKSFLLKQAEENNYRTAFASMWGTHFDKSYSREIEYLAQNTQIPMEYMHIQDDIAQGVEKDLILHKYILDAVDENSNNEKDIILGIYEAPDYNGHDTNFTNDNYRYARAMSDTDKLTYEVIQKIKARSNYENEDWLIILTSDHGGMQTWHGKQTLEERTTFLVTNKTLDTKFYSKNYNGYVIKG